MKKLTLLQLDNECSHIRRRLHFVESVIAAMLVAKHPSEVEVTEKRKRTRYVSLLKLLLPEVYKRKNKPFHYLKSAFRSEEIKAALQRIFPALDIEAEAWKKNHNKVADRLNNEFTKLKKRGLVVCVPGRRGFYKLTPSGVTAAKRLVNGKQTQRRRLLQR